MYVCLIPGYPRAGRAEHRAAEPGADRAGAWSAGRQAHGGRQRRQSARTQQLHHPGIEVSVL